MGHSLGVTDPYLKSTEKELREEYRKAVPHLTITETNELKRELSKKGEDYSRLEKEVMDSVYEVRKMKERLD